MPLTATHPWHALETSQVQEQLQTTDRGLSAAEAQERLEKYGPNELAAGKKVSAWKVLLAQFQNVLLLILIVATALSAYMGHGTEAIVIGIIVLFAVGLGFYQEYRAERAMEALRDMAAPHATVIRDGVEVDISAREVVPGDIVLLASGDKVPADCRLIEAANLQADEAPLTGESVPVQKNAKTLPPAEVAVADRTNIVYSGTAITYGRGRGIAIGTGMATEFGQIATMLHSVEEGRTPLQEDLDRVGRTLAKVALAIVAVIIVAGLLRQRDAITQKSIADLLIFGIALAVAVVPEALPAVVTVSLAIGVQRMVRRNALVRRLPAVETLGSTSVICSDKTGTLTKDEMTVRQIFAAGKQYEVSGAGYKPEGEFSCGGQAVKPDGPLRDLLIAGVLASDAHLGQEDGSWQVHGDPTEGALLAAAAKAGIVKEQFDEQFPRETEIPFSSETKRMTTLHRTPEGIVAYAKGAPEVLAASCSKILMAEGERPLASEDLPAMQEAGRKMGESALRVLALARKHNATLEDAERDLTLLGLAGMIDPPRSEAKAAVAKCEEAGIKVVMITGDHPLTAKAVARELGIAKAGKIVTGAELDALSDEQLKSDAEQIEVYARVSPAHKLRVVAALQSRGHVVAMTGDGVNDAPALRKADIGIAMGITGTDVTKEAAEMTLTDDNFASIVAAVEEGRAIYGNIKKYLMYLLSANVGEIGLMAGASLLGQPMPLTAVQILYVNLATDGLPALALAVDPPEDDLMRLPPRQSRRGIFTPPVVRLMMLGGVWSALSNLALFVGALYLEYETKQAMTMTFVSLVLIQFFKAYGFRSDHQHVLHRPFANKWLNIAILWELLLLVAILYIPALQKPFGTYPLTALEWLFIVAWSHTILPVLEFGKWLERRQVFGKPQNGPPVAEA